MKNKSEQDLAASRKTLTSLNADSALSAPDAEIFRLGQLMRESASIELPVEDDTLRAALVAEIDARGKNELAKPVSISESRRTWILAVASIAVLTLAILSVMWNGELPISEHAGVEAVGFETIANPALNLSQDPKQSANAQPRLSPETDSPATPWSAVRALPPQVAKKNTENVPQVTSSAGSTSNKPVVLNGLSLRPSDLVLSSDSSRADDETVGAVIWPNKKPRDPQISVSSGLATHLVETQPEAPETHESFEGLEPQVQILDAGNESAIKGALHAMFGDKIEIIESPNQNNTSSGETTLAQTRQAQQDAARKAMIKAIQAHQKRDAANGRQGLVDRYGESGGGKHGENENNEAAQMMKMMQQMAGGGRQSREQYDPIVENKFVEAIDEQALSTFSIDVDTASYSNMRRFISRGQRPPANSIRIEEWLNYFPYDYPQPKSGKPFHVAMEVAECPWQPEHRLVRIGIKGKDVHRNERPASNLVFLLDVSGSMEDQNKLPLLQRGLSMMLDRLTENDRISIVTYASDAGVRLRPTSGDQKIKIRNVIDNLNANGSTNGSAGIEQAYELAAENFIKDGTNRVILATDGDLNVGTTDDQSLVELIKRKASADVFLTVLGFGTGNLKDSKLEKLADHGNGVYAYIDSIREARKVLVQQMSASLVTIAKDVKLQVEFNPAQVKSYRLLGYENRKLANADFNNDQKDAGEIGAGHCVTALYEIVPSGLEKTGTLSMKLKYQQPKPAEPESPKPRLAAAKSGEMLTLAIRYKQPSSDESERLEFTLVDSKQKFYEASDDFRFAAAVASFGMLLRESDYSGNMDFSRVEKIASESIGEDESGYRAEFVDLIRQFSAAGK